MERNTETTPTQTAADDPLNGQSNAVSDRADKNDRPQTTDSMQAGGFSAEHGAMHGHNAMPIGVFDSGFGGMTVVREIIKALPNEDIVYFGDSGRCPYGPRPPEEVDGFVQQICTWFLGQNVKVIVIACNTATAAGLKHARQTFDIPIIGVIEPGSRAAAHTTNNKKVGVVATQATVESNAYAHTIRSINADITVFSSAAPRLVEIAEQGIRMAEGPIEDYLSLVSQAYIRPAFREIANEYLEPLRRVDVDTLVLGCTHFPLLKTLIGCVIGRDVVLIDPAKETARDTRDILQQKNQLASSDHEPIYRFYSSGNDLKEFKDFGSRVLHMPIENVYHLSFD